MDIDDPDEELAAPSVRADGRAQAARLLREMLDAGISRYHPDTGRGIEGCEETEGHAIETALRPTGP
jgi:hypothetical protein